MSFRVLVDDNYHYQDESERYVAGDFETLEVAVAACKKIVDDSLLHELKQYPDLNAEELYERYVSFGDDPFIVAPGLEKAVFSAWDYAQERSKVLARMA